MSQEESNKIETEVVKLLQAGIIEESTSSYSAPVFIATRKGKERVVFDYRGVNKQTEDFAYPMPNGEEILKATKDCKYFSVVDAKSGFHLLQLKDISKYCETILNMYVLVEEETYYYQTN
ncbi:hypothetical protein ACTFIU_010064 [Dictyostelium citrinum]